MNSDPATAVNEHLANARQHRRNGDRDAALAAFQRAAAADPADSGIKVDLASAYREADDCVSARRVLAEVLAAEPRRPAALIELGHICRRERNEAAAIAAFERAALAAPQHLGIRVEIARSRRALGEFAAAEALLDRVLAEKADLVGALVEKGHLCRGRGDEEAALAAFRTAAASDPGHAGIQIEMVESLARLGRIDEAEALLRRLVASRPDNAFAFLRLGRLLAEADRHAEAADVLLAMAERHPGDGRAPLALARIARRRGDPEEAGRQLERAAALATGNPEIELDLAAEFREAGRLDEARRILHSLLARTPSSARAWIQLGLAERAAGNRQGARAAFETAARHEPDRSQAIVEAAREAWALGDPGEARDLLRRALDKEPAHLDAHAVSAEFSLLAEEPEAALETSLRAAALDPRAIGPRLLAARAAASIPDRDAAVAILDDARAAFGATGSLAATEIHVFRKLCDTALARAAVNKAGDLIGQFPVWLECTTFAIATGDFAAAERLIERRTATSPREAARIAYLAAQLADARRDHDAALAHYRRAIALDPADGNWYGEAARSALLAFDLDAARALLETQMSLDAPGRLARGEPTRPSQSLVGQLLDDVALDTTTVARLRHLRRDPPEEALARLIGLGREAPENTAVAIALLLAIRRAGRFSRPVRDGSPPVPRQVFQFWDTGAPPPDIAALMASWRDADGGFGYRLFDDQSAAAFLDRRHPPEVARAYRRAEHVAQRADLFRLAFLAVEGGLYADADDRRAAPFEALVPAGATFAGYQENFGTIGNNFLAATPGHPVILRALGLAVAAINRGDRDSVWLSTGPGLLTRAFATKVAEDDGWLSGASLRELHEMTGVVEIHCPARYKTTPAHWSRAA